MFRLTISVVLLVAFAAAFDDERPKFYKDFDPVHLSDPVPRDHHRTYRLPNDTRPIRYDIELTTWVDQGVFDFNGNVRIHLQVEASHTNTITVHSNRQTIVRTELRRMDGRVVPTMPHQYNQEFQFLTVQTRSGFLLEHEEFILEIDYTAVLRTDDAGFYRSSYVNEDGLVRWLATTQFESTDARHAFPCYDEPGTRSVFGLTMVHGSGYSAIANMPVESMTVGLDGMTTTVFQDTPVMQTYLNAFVVSDFDFLSNENTKRPDALLQRVFGQPSIIASGDADFALEAGERIMEAMEGYFRYNYSLPKLDQIGIPDFAAGAMENWGLVTYREPYLYYNPETSPMTQLDLVASIVAHEYAHQFFGNTVSPQWWTYLWLNEGFATLYEYHAVDLVYPGLRLRDLMQISVCQSVMQNDASESARPMSYYAESPGSIDRLFDFIAYSKSGCVLKMLLHFLSDETFAHGLSAYLHRMEYKSVTPDDLYSSLQEIAIEEGALPSHLSVKEIMDSWANQRGYPMLTVERTSAGLITVTQDRFLLQASSSAQPQTWWVPFNFATKSSPDFSRTTPEGWIPQGTRTITVRPSGSVTWDNDDWIVFNKQASSYYRVNYDEGLWAAIIEELVEGDFSQIHLLNRAQLIDDAYYAARVMLIGYDTAFGLMEYLSNEMDYAPWASSNRVLTTVDRRIASLDSYDHFRTFVRDAVTPVFEKLGVRNIANEPYFDRLARNIAVRWACYVGSEECHEATTERIREHVDTEIQFEADNGNIIMCAGLRAADYETGFSLWLQMQASESNSRRYQIIDALVCSQDNVLLQQLMGTLIVNLGVNYSAAERTRMMAGIANSGIVGTRAVMEFMENFTEEVSDRVQFGATINNMASWISNQAELTRFTALLEELRTIGTVSDGQRNAALNTVRGNIEWVADYGGSIIEFLENYTQRRS